MRRGFIILCCITLGFSGAALSKKISDVQKIEDAVGKSLRDPYSAHWRIVASKKEEDGSTLVCGMVNAKNSFGAYTGEHPFTGRAGGQWPTPSGSVIPQLPADDDFCQKFVFGQ